MRRIALAAVMGVLWLATTARAEPDPGAERTVDLASGMTVASPTKGGGDVRPGLALAMRYYGDHHLYASGSLGASLAEAGDHSTCWALDCPGTGWLAATILAVGAGAGFYGEHSGWTGYAGLRAEWVKSVDWPHAASRDPGWFTSGVGAGPSVGLARRIGYAWGHPMAIELAAGYMVYSLRRPDVYVIQILPPGDAPPPVELDGLQVGLFLAGTLFPDRPR